MKRVTAIRTPAAAVPIEVVPGSKGASADDEREAREATAPLAAGTGVDVLEQSDLEPIAYEGLSDALYPEDHRYLADSFWTDEGIEGALVPLAEEFARAPSGKSNAIALMPGNGSRLGLPAEAAAYSMDERTLAMPYAVWQDPAGDAANREWITRMSGLLEPIATGHFVSEADPIAHPERLARCFSPENRKRIEEVRAHWDPDRVLHGMPGTE